MKRRAFLAAALLAAMPGLRFAQYPDRGIRMVVPFAPGAVKAALAKPQVVERGEKAGLNPTIDHPPTLPNALRKNPSFGRR
jgi:hypothetical protein